MLFRSEFTTMRSNKLSSDVAIIVPVSWQTIGYLIFVGLLLTSLFLSQASYTRIEVATGAVTPDNGVAAIIPTRSGVISAVLVHDDEEVAAGAELAAIRAEEDSASGTSTAAQIEAAMIRQDASLAVQESAAGASARAQLGQLATQRSGLLSEIAQIQSQIVLQQSLITSAQRDYDRARAVADKGFVSVRDLQQREEVLLNRKQGLSQLTQSLAGKRAQLAEIDSSAAQVAAQSRVQSASLAATRAQVAGQAANAAGARSYILRAPVAGRVTALTARIGQPANAQVPLMAIVPAGSVLRAELAIPSSAIGFVKAGQTVRLAIDAFPYQRFGTVKGKVLTVAASSISRIGPNGEVISAYPVTVALDQFGVEAFGRREPLISGMTLTARIITEKQSLLEWLFEPLYAVRRR